ncbi:MAG TPA: exodeoxyribonuclease III [Chthoniobacterales bacterium]|nr:exodeoxyribonuclease III [Chthoniobacterales bacterium]
MKIASWNINSLRKRQDRLFAWLENTEPDIVCLQETKCTDEQFPALALQSAGYAAAYHGEKSYNGVAILSKTKLTDVRASLCDEVVDPQARVISATIGNLCIYSIYAPNGQAVGSPAYKYKLKWYARLRDCLAKKKDVAGPASGGQLLHKKRPASSEERDGRSWATQPDAKRVDLATGRVRPNGGLVVCGDFNVAPQDVDVHDPQLWRGAIMCSDGERAAFQQLCEIGLRDTLRLHPQEPGVFTWWDYRMLSLQKNRGLRIDAVLVNESLAKKCTASGVDREMRKGKDPSDHAPIWAELKL